MNKSLLKSGLLLGAVLLGCAIFADTVKVENPVIVIPEKVDAIKKFAAEELKKHLELITGKKIEITEKAPEKTFPLYVGIPFPDDRTELTREEARYRITPTEIYMYGEDTPAIDLFNIKMGRTGTLFAVYFFLENELGVRWLEPGDRGIAYNPRTELAFTVKEFSWIPQLKRRFIAFNFSDWRKTATDKDIDYLPNEFLCSVPEADKKISDLRIWCKRMRMGSSFNIKTGHNVEWWKKYGKTNPEFFALFEGKRAPNPKKGPSGYMHVHACVSNRDFHKRLVDDWFKAWKEDLIANETINLCENDGRDYCTCPECTKLDVRKDGETILHMTDRYIWFANEVLKLARKKVPDVKVVMYVYADYLFPPRREKVSDGVIIAIVPTCLIGLKETDDFYKSWLAVGAKEIILRPNDLYINPGIPMGMEKKIFDAFKVGINNNVIGTMYDMLHEFWEVSGIEAYIMAKAFVYPEKDFKYWEDEYCSVFGPAKDDMKKYFSYWRENCRKNIWDEKEYPNKETMALGIGTGGIGLRKFIKDFFKPLDFDITDSFLENASRKNLNENEQKRLDSIKLANKHSRMLVKTLCELSTPKMALMEKIDISKKMLDFRIENKDKLNFCWPDLFKIEARLNPSSTQFARVFGNKKAENFRLLETSPDKSYLDWNFKIDPEDKGLKENWQNSNWDEISKNWVPVKTEGLWFEHPGMPEELSKKLRGYLGTGWYAARIKIPENLKGKEVYLIFGEVNESCRVYVNGKKAGERDSKNPKLCEYSFSIRIDHCFKDEEWQIITIRVTNMLQDGGICQPVWVAVEK